jgi:hypothetical protein
MAVQIETAAASWATHAHELAEWTVRHLLNRTDQWAQYLPVEQRSYSRIVRIAPPKQMRGQVLLTSDLIARHYAGANVGHLIGVYAKSQENSSKWMSIDLGSYDASAPASPAATLKAALAWYDTLKEQGFHPLLEDSSGRGDYHLWAVFGDKVDAGTAWMFGRALVGNYADLSLPAPPRIYPRRAQMESAVFKDWLRLPGRHHSHNHWSKIWDGARWLEGEAAVNAILKIRVVAGHFSLNNVAAPPAPELDDLGFLEEADSMPDLAEPAAEAPEPVALPSAIQAPPSAPGIPLVSPAPATPNPGSDESDLKAIVLAWPRLPPVVKAGIMAMVRSAQGHH